MSDIELSEFASKTPSRGGQKSQGRAFRLGIPRPLRAIRLKCLDCSGQQPSEVRDCTVRSCALWSYRMGRYPKP